jgi:nucleoside-diphosphate-sugar epimerase
LPKVVIAGCGFLGEAAAALFSGAGWEVLGLCATPESAARLVGRPYAIQATDITRPCSFSSPWHGADALIHCASSGRGGAESYRQVYLEGLLNLLTGLQPRRTLFVSSTSVYAQTDGSVVTESSLADPDRETGQILREAEGVALASGGYVARLSGLYGPGRSVLRRKFLSGEARLEGDGGRWINQIHRDDAAQAVVHLFQQRAEPGIYNVSDDTPATQREVQGWMAEYFQRPLPPTGEPDLSRKRGWTSKRVSNAKLRATGWTPSFPSFRHALPSLS